MWRHLQRCPRMHTSPACVQTAFSPATHPAAVLALQRLPDRYRATQAAMLRAQEVQAVPLLLQQVLSQRHLAR